MTKRNSCLLKNKELTDNMQRLRTALSEDFSKNLLKQCDNCSAGLSNEDSKELHAMLLEIYNKLSNIKRMLEKYKH